MLTENKARKYILYAIGEIILVVIGILIALFINNKNIESANEQKITNILKEVQTDILTNIDNSYEIFDYQVYTDSISKLIFNNKYFAEDYRLNKVHTLGYNYRNFDIITNGYDNLKSNFDNIPEKYKHLMPEIKGLYTETKGTIDDYNHRLRETVYKNIDNLTNYTWYQDQITNKVNAAKTNYYLNDIHYKNMVANYMNYRSNLYDVSNTYRLKATNIYLAIAKAIGNNDPIPDLIKKKPLDAAYLSTLTGTYQRTENTNMAVKNMEIKLINGELFLGETSSTESIKLHSRDKNIFYIQTRPYLIVVFNNPKKSQVYITMGNGNIYGIYNRVQKE